MLVLRNISYAHPDKERLFEHVDLSLPPVGKIALIGHNGSGKSTLLKIMAGECRPSGGTIRTDAEPYYVPQHFGQYDHLTVAEALKVSGKLDALKAILDGDASMDNLTLIDDDWTIEERCREAMDRWGLPDVALTQPMGTLSGGQKTKVFLAGIAVHRPALALLDEPSNHLDRAGREQLAAFIRSSSGALILVSHDRTLLNALDMVCELDRHGLTVYGGNYDFYARQKQIAEEALQEDIRDKERALRRARERERETLERQRKLDARGKGKQAKAGVARIMMKTLKNKAEGSTSRTREAHAEKVQGLAGELRDLRVARPGADAMKVGFDDAALHEGKVLFRASGFHVRYGMRQLWPLGLDLQINSGERMALAGPNGSGKTTLIRLILGDLEAAAGKVYRAECRSVYIDQDYSLIDNNLTVFAQAQLFNGSALQDHEVGMRLVRFLFTRDDWDKRCSALSGGERMRLMLCCLGMASQSPDMIVLDEPTNNLDIRNIGILTAAINEYRGTLIVVSHDSWFLDQVNIGRTLTLP